MALPDHHIFEGERDIPIDLTRNHEEGTQFARFYLERVSQNSNIYFVEQQEEAAKAEARMEGSARPKRNPVVEPRVSPLSVLWRLAWMFSFAGAAIALAVFVAPKFSFSGQQASASDFTGAYERVLAAQKDVATLHVGDAVAGLKAARMQNDDAHAASGLAATIGTVRNFFSHTTTPSSLAAVLDDVTARSFASVAPLADLSFASVFAADAGASAGGLIDRAFSETKNAEAAVDNAHAAILSEKEAGDDDPSFSTLGPQLSLIRSNLEQYAKDLSFASWALGTEYARQYLIVVQDPSLARATGGVVRSLGVVTVQKGSVSDVTFDEIYNVDGQLSTNVIPPLPIQKVATAWAIHDANWFLDFPTSARTIADFYKKTSGKSSDGVIAVNDHMLKRLLALTGPVAGKGGVLVNAESSGIAGDPAALTALTHAIKTLQGEKADEALRAIMDGLTRKDALVWLADQDYENAVRERGWGGEIVVRDGADYLAVAASDIEGSGTIGMTGEVLKETAIDEQGTITDTVVVEFANKNEATGKKLRYLRIYVPQGSELRDASGNSQQAITPQINYEKEHFIHNDDLAAAERTLTHDETNGVDVFSESGATVFGMWVPLSDKGGRVVVRYTVPFLMSDAAHTGTFASVFQKQPGMDMTLHFSVVPPEGRSVATDGEFAGDFHGPLADQAFTVTIK